MVDTVRTIDELLAIFANNTSGDITPQDMRDFVVTMEGRAPQMWDTAVASIHCVLDAKTGSAANPLYLGGMYEAPAADANLLQTGTTVTVGDANAFHSAHAFAVIGGTPLTNGSIITLTLSGVSINDAGERNGTDTEVIYTGAIAGLTTDLYLESTKKWLGTVTYTISSDGSIFNLDFNYGLCKYNDFGNRQFYLDGFEFEVMSLAATPGVEIEFLHHKVTGWTYNATAFVPGSTALYKLTTDVSAADNLIGADKKVFWKRADMSNLISGDGSEGFIIRVTPDAVNDVGLIVGNIFIKPTA